MIARFATIIIGDRTRQDLGVELKVPA